MDSVGRGPSVFLGLDCYCITTIGYFILIYKSLVHDLTNKYIEITILFHYFYKMIYFFYHGEQSFENNIFRN